MRRSVLFWAQETYADARTWGVDGSTLTQRSAYLNDYFLHGVRLAAAGDGRTEAARAFFAAAYTPIANASYRWPNPGPNQRDRFRLHRHRPGRDAELRLEADLRPPLVHPRAIRVRLGAAPRGCGRDARSRRAARRRDQGLRDRRERRLRRGRRVVLRCRTPPSATSSSSSGSTSEARSSSISPTPSTGTLATASSSLAHLQRGGDRRATACGYTVAPASASTIATARPAPRLAPVTTPTTPASSTVKVFIDVMIFGGNYRPTAPAGPNSTSFVLGRIHCEPG
jgi:hypothetical protein